MASPDLLLIGPRFRALEVCAGAFSTSRLADTYHLGIKYEPRGDYHIVHVNPKTTDRLDNPGTIGIVALVRHDPEGNFTGLVPREQTTVNGPCTSVLRVWAAINPTREVIVDYDIVPEDPSKARVVNVVEHLGPKDNRHPQPTPPGAWNGLIEAAHLSSTIDVPESIHRLVFGMDLGTGQALTDQTLEEQPLVPAMG
jgi:hypothetical protein